MAAYPTTTEHHKLCPNTSIMASPYSCDNTGTLDCAAAIESIKANQSNVGTIVIPKGVFKIATNLTIPIGMTLHFESGGYFTISTGKTLTINGYIDSGPQQIFSGAGSVSLGSLVSKAYVDWWDGTLTTAISALGSSSRTLYLSSRTYSISTDLTVPSTITLKPEQGALLQIVNTKTLTLSGLLEAGAYQIFDCVGSGKVSFASSSLNKVCPEWWGNTTAAFQACLIAAKTNMAVVTLSPKTYTLTSTINWPSISVVGVNKTASILDMTGAVCTILASEVWADITWQGFSVIHDNNVNAGVNIVDAQYGASRCTFNMILKGKSGGVTSNGFILRGVNPDTGLGNNNQYSNNFEQIRIYADAEVSGVGLWLYGQDIANGRCSANRVINSSIDTFTTRVKSNGFSNLFSGLTMNGVPTNFCYHFDGDTTYENVISGGFIEATAAHRIKLESTGALAARTFVTCVGVTNIHDSTSFTLAGDTTKIFYTVHGNNGVILGGPLNTAVAATASPIVRMCQETGYGSFTGGPGSYNGRFVASGVTYAGGIALVGNYGSASVVIAASDGTTPITDSEFRIVKMNAGVTPVKIFGYTSKGYLYGIPTTNSSVGSCTLDNTGPTSTVVSNTSITATSKVFLQASSVNAGALMAETTGVCVKNADHIAGASFTVTHKGTPGAGCNFDYWVVN